MSATTKIVGPLETPIKQGLQRFLAIPDWLTAVADPERVRTSLIQHVQEFASGELLLVKVEIDRLRLKRGQNGCWTGLYQLTVADVHDGQQRTVQLRGWLTPPGHPEPPETSRGASVGAPEWHCYLPDLRLEFRSQPQDEALPALPILTDPQQARALLERSISANQRYASLRIESCVPRVVRYKPGSRCTIIYDLHYPPEHARPDWPQFVVAKTYHGSKGHNAYESMRVLWTSPLSSGDAVSIAEPLAYLPDLHVLLQGPLREEKTLEKHMKATFASGDPQALDELHDLVRKTAVGLAALHHCGVQHGEILTWEDELAELRELSDRLAVPVPHLADAIQPLLDRLEALAAETPPDRAMPSHRAFRPAQVLIHQGQISFIDFDGFCQAEPALDLSRFLRKTRALGSGSHDRILQNEEQLQQRLAMTDSLCETFLSTYEELVPVSRQRVALWEALDLLTLVLFCWTKIGAHRIGIDLLLLERHLYHMGFR